MSSLSMLSLEFERGEGPREGEGEGEGEIYRREMAGSQCTCCLWRETMSAVV